MSISKFKNLPNFITLLRLITSFFLPFFLYYLLPTNFFLINISLSILFVIFSLTDFFDGYLARKYNLESTLGKTLDAIVDKFFILFPLIALVAIGKIYFFWVIIFTGRELFILGLRQIALENNFNIDVSSFGKLKTFFQVTMVAIIIANPDVKLKIFDSYWNIIQFWITGLTIFLSIGSAYKYYKIFKIKYLFKN